MDHHIQGICFKYWRFKVKFSDKFNCLSGRELMKLRPWLHNDV